LHKNAFGGQAPPAPAGGAITLPRLPSRCKVEGREERGRKGLGIMARGRKGGKGWT